MLTQQIEGRAVQRVVLNGGLVLDLGDDNELIISRLLRLTLPATGDYPVEEAAIDPGDVPVTQRPLLDIAGTTCTRAACNEDGHLHLEFSGGHQIDVASDEAGTAWELHSKDQDYAAAPERPTTVRRWAEATGAVVAAMHRNLLGSVANGRRPRRHYPRHYDYLEHACMEREMHRL